MWQNFMNISPIITAVTIGLSSKNQNAKRRIHINLNGNIRLSPRPRQTRNSSGICSLPSSLSRHYHTIPTAGGGTVEGDRRSLTSLKVRNVLKIHRKKVNQAKAVDALTSLGLPLVMLESTAAVDSQKMPQMTLMISSTRVTVALSERPKQQNAMNIRHKIKVVMPVKSWKHDVQKQRVRSTLVACCCLTTTLPQPLTQTHTRRMQKKFINICTAERRIVCILSRILLFFLCSFPCSHPRLPPLISDRCISAAVSHSQ